MKIGIKLTIIFFLIAFLSMLVVGIISYKQAKVSFETESFNRLTAVREAEANQITDYFQQIKDELSTMAEDPAMIDAMKGFKYGFDNLNKELNLSPETIASSKKNIGAYIDTVVLPKLNAGASKKVSVNEIVNFGNINADFLQDQFMVSNSLPIGSKHLLDSIGFKCSYNSVHKKYHPVIRHFLERFGYYDVFLVDHKTGNVVYTVYKEFDFGSSLLTGPFNKTNFADCFNKARLIQNAGEVNLVDFSAYLPSYNERASFMACPMFDGNEMIGIIAFQMPIDRINNIMTSNHQWAKVGLEKTGETYLIGEDFKLRNQSRFLIEDSLNYFKTLEIIGTDKATITNIKNFHSTIGLQEVKTEGTKDALAGNTGTKIFDDYRGVSVLSSYKPLKILGMNWAIMSEIDEEEAFSHVVTLRNHIIEGFVGLLIIVLLVSYFVSKQITKPLKELTIDAAEISNGNFDVVLNTNTQDEIGTLADGFRKMQISISNLVHGLEDKVRERTAEVVLQKDIIEEKQKEVLDSINYAKRIQYTLLANDSFLRKFLNDYFVIFKPKDIVSGDFYWATKTETKFYIAVCDSTGHGVPGAFMSLLNMSFLNEAINEKKIAEPNAVLDYVRERLIKNISKDGGQDGMDAILMCFDLETKEVSYSAANNAPILIREGAIIEYEADKMPVGIGVRNEPFKLFKMDVLKNDVILVYTDGFADQFGGPKGKKFKYKQLKENLIANHHLSLSEQKDNLISVFEDWKGNLEQVDDVCVIGIKI
ncbi:MAG: SpoIIE family protein phosphatase [Bacteroidota bacterium]